VVAVDVADVAAAAVVLHNCAANCTPSAHDSVSSVGTAIDARPARTVAAAPEDDTAAAVMEDVVRIRAAAAIIITSSKATASRCTCGILPNMHTIIEKTLSVEP